MLDIILIVVAIAGFAALVAYYEAQTTRLELELYSALDVVDELVREQHPDREPPFNLIDLSTSAPVQGR